MDTASVSARCCAELGVGSGPREATVLRAVSLVTSQLTPDPDAVVPWPNIDPAPPSIENAFCSCWTKAFMSPPPPPKEENRASKGFSGCGSFPPGFLGVPPSCQPLLAEPPRPGGVEPPRP